MLESLRCPRCAFTTGRAVPVGHLVSQYLTQGWPHPLSGTYCSPWQSVGSIYGLCGFPGYVKKVAGLRRWWVAGSQAICRGPGRLWDWVNPQHHPVSSSFEGGNLVHRLRYSRRSPYTHLCGRQGRMLHPSPRPTLDPRSTGASKAFKSLETTSKSAQY